MKLILSNSDINFSSIESQHLNEWNSRIEIALDKAINGSSGRVKDFYILLKKERKDLLIGKPNKLRDLRNKIEAAKSAIPTHSYITEKVKENVINIFNYSVFINSYLPNWGAYKYAQELNMNSCVYCNRLFTFTLDKIDQARTFNKTRDKNLKRKILKNIMSSKTRPEFDHFYPKAKFPYLALSIYNLVPSCHVCNSNLKGSRKVNFDELLNPFEDDFYEIIKITARLRSESQIQADIDAGKLKGEIKDHFGYFLFSGKLSSFDLKFEYKDPSETTKNEKAKKHIELYALEELYEMHKDHASRIIKNAIRHGKGSAKDIFARHADLFHSIEEARSAILGAESNPDKINQFPLSKLAIDIGEDFGVYR